MAHPPNRSVRRGNASRRSPAGDVRISHVIASWITISALTAPHSVCHHGIPTVPYPATAVSHPASADGTTGVIMTTEPAVPSTATALRRERQKELYRRALQSLPGGTNSNFRAWG